MKKDNYHCGPKIAPKWIRKWFSIDPYDNAACKIHDKEFSEGYPYFKSNWKLFLKVNRNFTYYRKIPKSLFFLIMTVLFGWVSYKRRK